MSEKTTSSRLSGSRLHIGAAAIALAITAATPALAGGTFATFEVSGATATVAFDINAKGPEFFVRVAF